MTRHERAAQIWSILAWAATNRQELTYDIVGRLIGVPRQGLGRLLEPIQSYCLLRGLPPLTILVVSETSGLPSPGFTATEHIPEERERVFAFDWLDHPAPTPELLEQAVRQPPSDGVSAAPVSSPTLSVEEWRRGVLETAGKWQGELERPEQGEYEQRESLS